MASFLEELTRQIREKETLLCVGIDPPLSRKEIWSLPQEEFDSVLESLFIKCTNLIRQTAPFVCCFKPNVAFFEQYGPAGMEVLQRVCKEIPPDIPIILDAKRSAAGDAAQAYATAFFSAYNGDCITLDPYLGKEGILPFIRRKGKGAFVVCRSSNSRSDDVQGFRVLEGQRSIASEGQEDELYMHVARMCNETREELEPGLSQDGGLVGLVVGATYPEDMKKIRRLFPDLWFLAPGVGAQGGDLEATIEAGNSAADSRCKTTNCVGAHFESQYNVSMLIWMREDGLGLIVNVGRAIADAENPENAAKEFRNKIREVRRKNGWGPQKHTDIGA